ncbi:MAG TPA: F0F1 ATP synthase subunit A, partial [Desulfotomaculum sp.]|nr:F0F1 ATP synthase subunit A [Desulfotomaculum sp.]
MVAEAGRVPEVSMIGRTREALNVWNIPEQPWRLGELFGYPVEVNPRTLIFTWVTMAVVLAVALAAARSAHLFRPGRLAALFEIAIDFMRDLIRDSME